MKKSSVVVLVISGALLSGCDSSEPWQSSSPGYTNNHYVAGRGYYHAPYHSWFPVPYNHYDASRGYFHGGRYTAEPHVSAITTSQPSVRGASSASSRSSSSTVRGGFTSSRSIGS